MCTLVENVSDEPELFKYFTHGVDGEDVAFTEKSRSSD